MLTFEEEILIVENIHANGEKFFAQRMSLWRNHFQHIPFETFKREVDRVLAPWKWVEIAVQVLGKLRGRALVPAGAANDVLLVAARAAVAAQLEGKTVVKEIIVPGKLVNFVVE
jgi:leucyl-tRNA synthetase